MKIRLKIENFIGKEPFIQKGKFIENERAMSTRIQLDYFVNILGFQIGRMDSNSKIPHYSLH